MSSLTIPNSFAPNTTMLSALMNANYAAVVTWSTLIDNTNIGPAGILPTNLRPTSATNAQFGGAYGYTFAPTAVGVVPVTINGQTGQTSDIFQLNLNAVKKFSVNSGGQAVFAASPTGVTFTPLPGAIGFTGTTVTSTDVALGGDAGTIAGLLLNVPTGSTNGFQFQVAGSNVATISNAGVFTAAAGNWAGSGSFGGALKAKPTINGHAVSTWVPPLYTSAAGATAAVTAHKEFGRTATLSPTASATITLTNNAVFISSTSYVVVCTPIYVESNVSGTLPPVVTMTSGTSFKITNASAGGSHREYGVSWMAVGT